MVRIVVALSALASLVPACVLDTSGTGNLPAELWVQPAALPADTLGETSPRAGLQEPR